MIRIIVFICLVTPPFLTIGQEVIDWGILADVTFEKKYSEEWGMNYDHATFGESVKAFDGKEVIIKGYVIPMDGLGLTYALSRNPNASCFFCGGAGPETVLELKIKTSALRRFNTDENLSFKGILRIHEMNDNQFTYVLKNAEPL